MKDIVRTIVWGIKVGLRVLAGDPNPTATPDEAMTMFKRKS